ncbi:MAG: excinuclease ABC subunit UvrA [Thermodesulfobium narugense]|nr:MAG: excinuclease ABC subunit UvrA [Thermodesulfobium narugense]
MDYIRIRGAKENNLKDVNLDIPRNKFVVFTGVSGSGKSSLAFDTLYAEGQRRYAESLSVYARQFLGQLKKPQVESIEGLSPAVSIDQRGMTHNPRSTVGTLTEIYDYFRLLFARIGVAYCPKCNIPIKATSLDEIVSDLYKKYPNELIMITSVLIDGRKGEFKDLINRYRKQGFFKIIIDSKTYDISEEEVLLDKNKKHTIILVIDEITLSSYKTKRLSEAVRLALEVGNGVIRVQRKDGQFDLYSEKLSCPKCGFSLVELSPRLFSFNSPYGACPACNGLGFMEELDPEKVFDMNLSLQEGAARVFRGRYNQYYVYNLLSFARSKGISISKPVKMLSSEEINLLLFGDVSNIEKDNSFESIAKYIERKRSESFNESWNEFKDFFIMRTCSLCNGTRLRKEALSVYINKMNIADLLKLVPEKILAFIEDYEKNIYEYETHAREKEEISRPIFKEIKKRLRYLLDLGLDYLTLDRATMTLSGGEVQRLRLATQIGSGLVGVLYVLDEPSIGLHPRDISRLVDSLRELSLIGNTVIVVEHDRETIEAADFVVDMGPYAGERGGKVVYSGDIKGLYESDTLTGKYLSGKLRIVENTFRRKTDSFLRVFGASQFNLKNIDINLPLKIFCTITGVSGSGKSTLLYEILYKGIKKEKGFREMPGQYESIEGVEKIDRVLLMDQSPIGRTPRSNPATYTGVLDDIRSLFAQLPESKRLGFKPGHFSFNVKGGRCEACRGEGFKKIQMLFLPDVYVPCDVCNGTRYQKDTLKVEFKGKNISEILNMSVDEAREFFSSHPAISRKLSVLSDIGLGYIRLGQSATTLSGGESQRLKLAYELTKKFRGHTLYLLDEPTTGLHFDDIKKLINVLHRLVDRGDSVIVVEHNLDVVYASDMVIDLGPEGGDKGGKIVAFGTPEEIMEVNNSFTGKYLKEWFGRS